MSAPARRIDGQRLEDGGALVEVPGGGGGLDHRVLAADVVGGDRQPRRVLDAADDVEVGQRRLDHDDVGALLDVEQRLAQRLVAVGRDPSGSRGGRRTPASSRRPRGTGRRRRRRTSRCRRRSACRLRPSSSSAARIAPTRPSIMSLGATTSAPARACETRGAREQLDATRRCRRVPSAREQAAVAVARVLAQAHVGR